MCENGPRKKITLLHFPWNFLHFRECEEVAEISRQCTFSSHGSSFFDVGSGDCSRDLPKTLKRPSGCAYLLVHTRRRPSQRGPLSSEMLDKPTGSRQWSPTARYHNNNPTDQYKHTITYTNAARRRHKRTMFE